MNEKVLEFMLVDDDPMNLLMHKILLQKNNITDSPHTFYNGLEALEFITKENNGDSDLLILLDINMPIMDGWEFLEEVNSRVFARELYIIMLSSSINPLDKHRAQTYSHVINYLEKPFTGDKIQQLKSLPEIADYFAQ